jgi:hypothetical protein
MYPLIPGEKKSLCKQECNLKKLGLRSFYQICVVNIEHRHARKLIWKEIRGE